MSTSSYALIHKRLCMCSRLVSINMTISLAAIVKHTHYVIQSEHVHWYQQLIISVVYRCDYDDLWSLLTISKWRKFIFYSTLL